MSARVRHTRRQATRKAVIFAAFLLMPVILNYFSPYVIIDGAAQGIVNGSLVLFALLFLSSLFLGRLWCAWGCPAGGLQEACFAVNERPARGGKLNWIKWGIWIPWIAIIALQVIAAGGYRTVNLLHLTDSGISVDQPVQYITYYLVIGTFFGTSLLAGRRGVCHYMCWMAPFMILGRKLSNASNLPSVRLRADSGRCAGCLKCTSACPMSLDVHHMVTSGDMENSECILCGTCVDTCARQVIAYRFATRTTSQAGTALGTQAGPASMVGVGESGHLAAERRP